MASSERCRAARDPALCPPGRFLPGTHIPIYAPERLLEDKPDLIVILPWNLKTEIVAQLQYAREWGAKFVVPIPELTVI